MFDPSRYPANWKEIRSRVLARDQDKCKFCGVPNHVFVTRNDKGEWREVSGMELELASLEGEKVTLIVLTVAHLNHDKGDDESTLAALCQKCHLNHDIRHHVSNAAKTRRLNKERVGQLPLI